MEAESYLSDGYGHLLALVARLGRASPLADVANVWQPNRLKGTVVSAADGTAFLAATQAFDLRPIPRKFLALERTDNTGSRFVAPGTILVTRSGTVGRATIATNSLSGVLLSDDLLRVEPKSPRVRGWVYAFLRAPNVRAMMRSAQYGHIIKHLEPSHLLSLPAPQPRDGVAEQFNIYFDKILSSRNQAESLLLEAESLFEDVVGKPNLDAREKVGFEIAASELGGGRRRFESTFHSPTIRTLHRHFHEHGFAKMSLADAGFEIWLPTRFRRVPAQEGVLLVGSSDLFEINPDLVKRIADRDIGDRYGGRVQRGWLLLARSGQIYGLNGTLAIASAFHEHKIISDHVIRIAPGDTCRTRAGYIYTALSHPLLGRPMVKSLAYGSSIPEIEVADIAGLPIVRLGKALENRIADLAEGGAALFAEANIIETEMGSLAGKLIDDLVSGDWSSFVPSNTLRTS